jgi:1-acyl-sn-glycerol-3-phosphate acyltransferase
MVPICWAASKLILWLVFRLKYGLEVRGQEHVPKRGPFILASNHISFLDPPLLGVACPRRVRFLARADLFSNPVLGPYLRCVGVMPLRRGETDVAAMRAALSRLEQGEGVAIFPEGHRQDSGRLSAAKRGVGMLAVAAKAPIVPVLVRGTHDALPPNAKSLQHAKIRVAFGPPIPYTNRLEPAGPSDAPPTEGQGRGRARHAQLAEAVTQSWQRLAQQ